MSHPIHRDALCAFDESGCGDCDYAAASGTGTVFTGDTDLHVSETRNHSCTAGGAGPELSVSWTAPDTRCYRTEITSTADLDTILSVYATCELADELACDDNSGFDQFSRLEFAATRGTTYAIVVDSYFSTDSGPVNIEISPCPFP